MGHEGQHGTGKGSVVTTWFVAIGLYLILGLTNSSLQGVSPTYEASMAAKKAINFKSATFKEPAHALAVPIDVKRLASSQTGDGTHEVYVVNGGTSDAVIQLYRFADASTVVPESGSIVVPPSRSGGVDDVKLVGKTPGVYIGMSIHVGDQEPTTVMFANQYSARGSGPKSGNKDVFYFINNQPVIYLQRMPKNDASGYDVTPITGSS